MNKYSQIVLTIIAICLIVITVRLWMPFKIGPTMGDYKALSLRATQEEIYKVLDEAPLIKTIGG